MTKLFNFFNNYNKICTFLIRFVESANDPSTDPVVVWMVSSCIHTGQYQI